MGRLHLILVIMVEVECVISLAVHMLLSCICTTTCVFFFCSRGRVQVTVCSSTVVGVHCQWLNFLLKQGEISASAMVK